MTDEDDRVPAASEEPASSAFYSLAGHTLGRYRLVEKLGQGGMAQVYKAYQPELDRYVAVKILHPHLTGDEEFEARFRREARAIAALEHPNIVRLYDFDTGGGLAFLVMEYLEGTNLRERLRDLDRKGERMPLAEVCGIVCALAEALDYAHRRGLVHRDIKPSNVHITSDGRPVLTDFGVARMVYATAITEGSGTLGTPAYMSPEQGKGEAGDARSDIYALGVVLYQLCVGRVPFDADTPYAVILKHITAPLASPRSIRPELPDAIERVILKAMAKTPEERFQTAAEMAAAVRAALERRDVIQARSPGSGRARSLRLRLPWRALASAVAGVILLAAILTARPWRWLPLGGPSPATPAIIGDRGTVEISGPQFVQDTWIDPDTPEDLWHEADLVHLQGPLTPDRLLFRFELPDLPEDTRIVSATLTLMVELWGEQSLPGAAVAYRMLTPWEADRCNYNQPWQAPGLARGLDYDMTPVGLTPVPDKGYLTLDVTRALFFWYEKKEPNHGLVVMMSKDSHNQAHHRVYMTEQPDPTDRPTLRFTYEVAK